MVKKLIGGLVGLLLIGMVGANVSEAALTKSDFLVAGDGLLVTDTVTGFVWLSPFFTRGQSYNEVVGGFGDLLTTHGFQFATAAEVRALISNNFNNPPLQPGDAAGFVSATDFFNVFGLNQGGNCPGAVPPGACPRTQGWAVDGSTLTGLGMITLGGTVGGVIDFTATVASQGDTKDGQRGVWLYRLTPVPTRRVIIISE